MNDYQDQHDDPGQQPAQWQQTGAPAQPEQGGGKAIAALVLGIVGMLGWCLPLCGFPINLVGLILGIMDLKGPKRTLAVWGVVLCSIGLGLTVINAIIGAVMALNGQGPFGQP